MRALVCRLRVFGFPSVAGSSLVVRIFLFNLIFFISVPPEKPLQQKYESSEKDGRNKMGVVMPNNEDEVK